jgi:hypothetical protein
MVHNIEESPHTVVEAGLTRVPIPECKRRIASIEQTGETWWARQATSRFCESWKREKLRQEPREAVSK